jgi:site-specific DNA recombinase
MKAKTAPATAPATATGMNAVAYYRISTDKQSLQRQQSDIQAYCNYKGYNLLKALPETETGKMKVRPVLTEMLEYVKSHSIDVICISELSRLGRSNEILNTIEYLNSIGVNLYSLKEGINTLNEDKTINPNAALLTSVMSGINAFELTTMKYRIKSGMKEAAKTGGCNTSDVQPMGYTKTKAEKHRKIIIDAEESKLVERIFNLYVNDNKGVSQICRLFNSEGIPSKRGKKFKDYTITAILRNTIYIGMRRYKGEVFELPDLQIISNDLFNKAQTILTTHAKKMNMGKKHYYLLDNRLITCGMPNCGKSYHAHKSNPNSLTGAGNLYRCISKKYNDPCGNYGININKLERAVIANIEKYFPLDVVQQLDKQYFLNEIESKKSMIVDIDLQLKNYNSQLDRIKDIYVDGGYTKVKYNEKKQAIELKQITDQMKQIRLSSEVTNLEYESQIPEYSQLNRDVVQKLVQSIVIHPIAKEELSLKQKNDKAVKVVLTIKNQSISFILSHFTDMNEVLNIPMQMTA